jgi:triosephosphate isomerase
MLPYRKEQSIMGKIFASNHSEKRRYFFMENNKFMNKSKQAAKDGFDVVHDTVDVIGDATSSASKRVSKIATNAMSNNGGKRK